MFHVHRNAKHYTENIKIVIPVYGSFIAVTDYPLTPYQAKEGEQRKKTDKIKSGGDQSPMPKGVSK